MSRARDINIYLPANLPPVEHIHFHFHFETEGGQPGPSLDPSALAEELRDMTKNLDDLTAEVSSVETVQESAAALISGFGARLDAAIAAANDGDDAALPNLSASLKTSGDALAAAVTANTPAAAAPADPAPADPAPVDPAPVDEEPPVDPAPAEEPAAEAAD